MPDKYDFLIVGAGFAGAVTAERLAAAGRRCLIVERRNHIAGNAYDYRNEVGLLVHKYGPHYFRTNAPSVVDYLSRFTDWHPVAYKVLSWTHGQHWQFPINLNTFELFIGRPSTPEEMQATLEKWRVPIDNPRNSEEVIVSQVGWELYEMFFRNYTRKQWSRDPKDLDPSVCGRIPIRTNRDDRYLDARFQALPKDGYTKLFERMLDHPLIDLELNADFRDWREKARYDHLIYTGMIDEYFDFKHGPLPYRTLRFEEETVDQEQFQPAMQVNYPNEEAFTRIVELKHATGEKNPRSTIVREYPQEYQIGREAYYPIPAPDAKAIYRKYANELQREPDRQSGKITRFVGRLATYRYYNMDQVVASALQTTASLT